MLARLHLQNFTVFADADFQFSEGLNVLVGTNGTGKSHVLKAGYAVMSLSSSKLQRVDPITVAGALTETLQAVFLPGGLVNLVRDQAEKATANIWAEFDGHKSFEARIMPHQDMEDRLETRVASVQLNPFNLPLTRYGLFIPAKEILSFFNGFRSLYTVREVSFDSTYYDLAIRLGLLPLREIGKAIEVPLQVLQQVMGGSISIENEQVHFVPTGSKKQLPITLYAEGLRKFATLWQLLRNGSLTPETTLFWDEPEANLNPQLLRKLARVLATLARAGFQIILATHSMFLLKELHILSREKDVAKLPIRYFGLNADKPGDPVTVTTEDDFEVLPDIVALDEELEQSGTFLDVLNAND